MANRTVLCIYGTRQVDSNVIMSGVIYRALQESGYTADLLLAAPPDVASTIQARYAEYFRSIFVLPVSNGWLARFFRSEKLKVLYSFLRHFVLDAFLRPYRKRDLLRLLGGVKANKGTPPPCTASCLTSARLPSPVYSGATSNA